MVPTIGDFTCNSIVMLCVSNLLDLVKRNSKFEVCQFELNRSTLVFICMCNGDVSKFWLLGTTFSFQLHFRRKSGIV